MRGFLFLFAGACSTGAVLPPVVRGPVSSQSSAVHLSRAAVLHAWVDGLQGNCERVEHHMANAVLVGGEHEEIREISSRIAQECRAVEAGDRWIPQGVDQ